MEVFRDYLLQNWSLILVLVAFAITLKITVFLEKKTIIRMYVLIVSIFVLSIVVFIEFYLDQKPEFQDLRAIMTAIRYSATPLIIATVLYALVKRARWYVYTPAIILAIVNIISIPTGIVFSFDANGALDRGIIGYLPYVGVGAYSFALVFLLIIQSNKHITELIPIIFLAFAFGSGIILPLPFALGKEYSKIFCSTLAIVLFIYYVFLILQLTKKDPLTGLLNRQAYYSLVDHKAKDITGLVSIDMNGLKKINDRDGHAAGDEALKTISLCFIKAVKFKYFVFRVGGDEFVIVCLRTSEEDIKALIKRIERYVSETKYSCAIGYCYIKEQTKDIDSILKQSDEMMYKNKAEHYANNDRRNNEKQ